MLLDLSTEQTMDFCSKPITLGVLHMYANAVCPGIFQKNVLFTPDAFDQACDAFSPFVQSMKLIQGTCPGPIDNILLKAVSLKAENGTDPLLKELERGKIDVIAHPYIYSAQYQNVSWALPIVFSRHVLLIGPKALIPYYEPLTLLLAPFTSIVWLISVLSVAVVGSLDVLHTKIRKSTHFFCLGQVMALLYLLYTSNLKAVISQPSESRLPFNDLQELVANLNLGKRQLVIPKVHCPSWRPLVRKLIPGLHRNYQPDCNYNSPSKSILAASLSENLFTLMDEATALRALDYKGSQVYLANVSIWPVSTLIGGFLVSKQRKQLAEHISRTSEIVGALYQLEIDRLSSKRSRLHTGMGSKRTHILIGHLKLLFLIAVIGYGIALSVFLLEMSVLIKGRTRRSLDLLTSGRQITQETSMDDGVFRTIAFE